MSGGSQHLGKWSNPIPGVGPRRSQRAYTVPDDWDTPTAEEDKDDKQIWEEANSKAPMPQIVISSGNTPAPPPTAFAPSLKILKRPQSASPRSTTPNAPQKSLAEREAEYKAARERIFASRSGETSINPSALGTWRSSEAAVQKTASLTAETTPRTKVAANQSDKQPDIVIRQPRGPSLSSSRGFGNKRSQVAPRGRPSGSETQSISTPPVSPRAETPPPSSQESKLA